MSFFFFRGNFWSFFNKKRPAEDDKFLRQRSRYQKIRALLQTYAAPATAHGHICQILYKLVDVIFTNGLTVHIM